MNPTPSIHTPNASKHSSTFPLANLMSIRIPPKERIYQKDKLQDFGNVDIIKSFVQINHKHEPKGFQCYVAEGFILFYNLVFSVATSFPKIYEATKIDTNLKVQLQYCGNNITLPS